MTRLCCTLLLQVESQSYELTQTLLLLRSSAHTSGSAERDEAALGPDADSNSISFFRREYAIRLEEQQHKIHRGVKFALLPAVGSPSDFHTPP